jgi:hypothetical protein
MRPIRLQATKVILYWSCGAGLLVLCAQRGVRVERSEPITGIVRVHGAVGLLRRERRAGHKHGQVQRRRRKSGRRAGRRIFPDSAVVRRRGGRRRDDGR